MAKQPDVPFDFAGWRERMRWSRDQAQEALGVSRTYYWKIEKAGSGSRMAAWAAYGIELYERDRRV